MGLICNGKRLVFFGCAFMNAKTIWSSEVLLPFYDHTGTAHGIHESVGFIDEQGSVVLAPSKDRMVKRVEGSNSVAVIVNDLGFDTEYKTTYSYQLVNSFGDKSRIFTVREPGAATFEISQDSPNFIVTNFKKNQAGLLNTELEVLLEPKYENVSAFKSGIAAVWKEGKCIYINNREKNVFDQEFSWCGPFENKRAVVADKDDPEVVVEFLGIVIHHYDDFNIINEKGERLCDTPKRDIVVALSNISELIPFSSIDENGFVRWGFLDRNCKVVVDPKYLSTYPLLSKFSTTLAQIDRSRIGVFDKEGTLMKEFPGSGVFPLALESVFYGQGNLLTSLYPFYFSGLEKGNLGLVDSEGKILTQSYDGLGRTLSRDGTMIVRRGGKFGAVDLKGTEIVPLEFERIDYVNEGIALALQNGKWGIVEVVGNPESPTRWIIPATYNYSTIYNDHKGQDVIGLGEIVRETKMENSKEVVKVTYPQKYFIVKSRKLLNAFR